MKQRKFKRQQQKASIPKVLPYFERQFNAAIDNIIGIFTNSSNDVYRMLKDRATRVPERPSTTYESKWSCYFR